MLSDGGQIFVPGQQLLVHRPCDVGQDARRIHNGVFAPIPCGGGRPKECTGTRPAPLCWPWTTDRPISRFSFLTLRDRGRADLSAEPADSNIQQCLDPHFPPKLLIAELHDAELRSARHRRKDWTLC
jgi:hypothetical protein